MNKNIAYFIISVCLLLAAFLMYRFTSGSGSAGLAGIDADSKIWVMCKNASCQAAKEMGERDFYAAVEGNTEPGRRLAPGLPCDQCGKPSSVYKAKKCPESDCLAVFFYGSTQNDFPDRCPQCKVSQTEKSRKERQSGSAQE